MTTAPLTQLGRYRIVSELGRGAMGVVYRAEDPLLNRTVAIKTIIMSDDAGERAEYEARFYQEAKAAGGLNHPNVVTVHDIGREGAIAYMAMELIDGIELREMMKQGRAALPLPLALDILAQVAEGLAFAHERGVVHRDVKPGNVMVVRGRHVKIMDFGIARIRESDIQTRTGAILGSPKYMSPEQVAGERTDHRSDIFSLGVMLYELATGEPPFTAPQVTQLMHNIATVTPRNPSVVNPSLPVMLDLIIGKALEKDVALRYQSAAELADDLRACAAALPPVADWSGEATLRLDVNDSADKTQVMDIGATRTVPNADAIKTMMTAGAATATRTLAADKTAVMTATAMRTRATDTGVHLILSPRFDSSDAYQRLVEQPSQGVAQGENFDTSNSSIRQLSLAARARMAWRDPERRVLIVAIAIAAVVALGIAFVGVGE